MSTRREESCRGLPKCWS
uniref:Uncharacterized protein n=1 Tax=Rhizophora mucronata TaxID=61149 RepID=A0A2P2QK15_RHIMU